MRLPCMQEEVKKAAGGRSYKDLDETLGDSSQTLFNKKRVLI